MRCPEHFLLNPLQNSGYFSIKGAEKQLFSGYFSAKKRVLKAFWKSKLAKKDGFFKPGNFTNTEIVKI